MFPPEEPFNTCAKYKIGVNTTNVWIYLSRTLINVHHWVSHRGVASHSISLVDDGPRIGGLIFRIDLHSRLSQAGGGKVLQGVYSSISKRLMPHDHRAARPEEVV